MIRQEAIKVLEIVIKAIEHIDFMTDRIIGIDICRISFGGYEMYNLRDLHDELKRISQPRAL